jgi:hypothetical protein
MRSLWSPKEYMLLTDKAMVFVRCQTGALSVSSQWMFD